MLLTQRENNILKKTIEDYISFGAPISSQRLHSCFFIQLLTQLGHDIFVHWTYCQSKL